ncbi:MAG: preprotein translocase subunit SecE [Candidatus Omnitrophota bacterium]|jgi:preprotein translocase subunit SecE|nr:preprotein translocase subunit SecE [Candidatus Omnitrophota bacterium]
MIGKIKKFVMEVASELKKVSWTTRSELIEATWVVLISAAILGIYIGTIDLALSKFLSLLIR